MGLTRTRVRVEGIVQGVGFRPFVHALAGRLGLAGLVGNDAGGVFVEVEGAGEAVERFLEALRREAPPLAVIERVTATPLSPTGTSGFAIAPSQAGGERQALVSPDTATCADCLAELGDPADRRHRYPFVNCTNCGPRFTIIRDVPYDRPATTMAAFAMCADCAREYHDPGDRRFHAQPVCCPACGPALRSLDRNGRPVGGDPLAGAAARLRDGAVVAVKGLGGYHLAADAAGEPAVAALRARKHREDKPFAVMVDVLRGPAAAGASFPTMRRDRPEHRSFSAWLAGVLKREGLSQEAAARQLGVSVKTVSRWVGGETEPRLRELRRIHDLFGEGPIG
jgi:hydrogenase maturation protein HypF